MLLRVQSSRERRMLTRLNKQGKFRHISRHACVALSLLVFQVHRGKQSRAKTEEMRRQQAREHEEMRRQQARTYNHHHRTHHLNTLTPAQPHTDQRSMARAARICLKASVLRPEDIPNNQVTFMTHSIERSGVGCIRSHSIERSGVGCIR